MQSRCRSIVSLLAVATGCGAPNPTSLSNPTDGNVGGVRDGASGDAELSNDASPTGDDAGMGSGGAITCPGPGMPKPTTSTCGSERWDIKVGTDSHAAAVSLVPRPNTIAALVALPAAGGGTQRESPTETTLWQLTDVTLTELKLETDNDYHLVLADGTHTMIAEIPAPRCSTGSAWSCFTSRARSEIDAKYLVSASPLYPAATVTLRGVGFFDLLHGQSGVAPNAIELHPVLQICFGHGCTPT